MPVRDIPAQPQALQKAKRGRRLNQVSLAYGLLLLWVMALIIGWFSMGDATAANPLGVNQPLWMSTTGADRLMGYDQLGTPIGPMILHAFFFYPLPLVLGTLIFAIGGIVIGILRSGFFIKLHTVIEIVLDKLMQIVELFPAYIAIIMIAWYTTQARFELAEFWKNLNMAACALALLNIPFFAKVVARKVNQLASMDFIEAERAMGLKKSEILIKHIFIPYLVPSLILTAGSFLMELVFMDIGLSYISMQLGEFDGFPSTGSFGILLAKAYVPSQFDVGPWYFFQVALIVTLFLLSIRYLLHLARTIFVEGMTNDA